MLLMSDLVRDGRKLIASCNGCGHRRERDASTISVDRSTPVLEVGKLMKCSKCGGTDILTIPETLRSVRQSA